MNPISSLRKLGVRLVGDDGLLTNAAARHIGLGPLEKAKMMTAAREQGLKEAASKQGLEKGALELEKGAQDLELEKLNYTGKEISNDKDRFGLEQSRLAAPIKLKQDQASLDSTLVGNRKSEEELTQAEEERAQRLSAVRYIRSKAGDPNFTDEMAEELLSGSKALKDSGLTYFDTEVGGVKPGIRDTDMARIAADAARAKMAEINANARLNQTQKMQEKANLAAEMSRYDRVAREAKTLKSFPDYKAVLLTKNHVNNMNKAWDRIMSGDETNINAAGQAIITEFNKILDPNSVVRESEFARSVQGQPLVERMKAFVQQHTVGGNLTPGVLRPFVDMANEFAELAAEYEEATAGKFENIIRTLPGADDEYVARMRTAHFGASTSKLDDVDNDIKAKLAAKKGNK